MGFQFTKTDDYQSLHPNIASYMHDFVKHRVEAYEQLVSYVEIKDFSAIRDYCHGQLGVAGSYRCFKLEEIIRYIQKYARDESIAPIEEVLPLFKSYLKELEAHV